MKCAWQEVLAILPQWMRLEVDRLGRLELQELRLRLGETPILVGCQGAGRLLRKVEHEDLSFVINTASEYSPWAAATASMGYITASGGHRIGICGETVINSGEIRGIRRITSVCIRIARDFPGISGRLGRMSGSVLIIGSPGSGKTTLLRDMIRQRSQYQQGSVAVVDERGELFPSVADFGNGVNTDVLSGCNKSDGIPMLLRTMGPQTIAVDEITSEQDCQALIKAGWCGVSLLATAHASTREDLDTRPVYKPLVASGLFDVLVILGRDKSWRVERMLS